MKNVKQLFLVLLTIIAFSPTVFAEPKPDVAIGDWALFQTKTGFILKTVIGINSNTITVKSQDVADGKKIPGKASKKDVPLLMAMTQKAKETAVNNQIRDLERKGIKFSDEDKKRLLEILNKAQNNNETQEPLYDEINIAGKQIRCQKFIEDARDSQGNNITTVIWISKKHPVFNPVQRSVNGTVVLKIIAMGSVDKEPDLSVTKSVFTQGK